MNNIRNRVSLIGHLGMDPEVKKFGKDRKVARFTMATNESYKNSDGEKVSKATWHRIHTWGKLAEILEKYAKKGMEVAVEGKLVNNDWEDKEGAKHHSTEIEANDVLFLSAKHK